MHIHIKENAKGGGKTPTLLSTKSASILIATSALWPFLTSPALSATQTWQPSGVDGGAGGWDATTLSWSGNSAWINGNDAVFNATPAFPTVSTSGVTANSITANTTTNISGQAVTLSGNAGIAGTGTLTMDSVIAGTAGLNKSGSGTVVINAQSTYTGNTSISDGTVSIGVNDGLSTSTNLTVSGDGSFNANGFQQTVSGVTLRDDGILDDRVGTGRLTSLTDFNLQSGQAFVSLGGNVGLNKTTNGSLILSGANTYTGATNVTGGTLSFTDNNALPTTTVLTINGATTTVNLTGAQISVAGVILRGGATISDSFGGTGSLTSSSDFIMESGTVNARLAGTAGLQKTTDGTVIITEDATYTGPTSISGGSLIVNAGIQSNVQITNGILGGFGVVNGNVTNAGTVQPGYDLSRNLTINGNFTQTATGNLSIKIASASRYNQLVVNQAASLGGKLTLAPVGGYVPRKGDSYRVLTATTGVTGRFSNVTTSPLIKLKLDVIYQPTFVLVNILESRTVFSAIRGLTPNQHSVARALDRLNEGRFGTLLDNLTSENLRKIPQRLDEISPDQIASVFDLNFALADAQAANLKQRFTEICGSEMVGSSSVLAEVGEDPKAPQTVVNARKGLSGNASFSRKSYFAVGAGEFTHIGSDYNARGYDFSTAGFTFGMDKQVTPNLVIGWLAGYASTRTDLSNGGYTDAAGGKVGVYTSHYNDSLYFNSALTGGINTYDFNRNAYRGRAKGEATGAVFDALLNAGKTFRSGLWTYGPDVDVQYTYAYLGSFRESGSQAPLDILDGDSNSLRSRIGFQIARKIPFTSGTLMPALLLGWQHDYLNDNQFVSARFIGSNQAPFTVTTPNLGRDSLNANASLTLTLTNGCSASLAYGAQLGRNNKTSQNVSGTFRIPF